MRRAVDPSEPESEPQADGSTGLGGFRLNERRLRGYLQEVLMAGVPVTLENCARKWGAANIQPDGAERRLQMLASFAWAVFNLIDVVAAPPGLVTRRVIFEALGGPQTEESLLLMLWPASSGVEVNVCEVIPAIGLAPSDYDAAARADPDGGIERAVDLTRALIDSTNRLLATARSAVGQAA